MPTHFHPLDGSIVPGHERVLLRLNLVSTKTPTYALGLDYTFGLQATPVKPSDKDAWDYRIGYIQTPVYGFEEAKDSWLPTWDKERYIEHVADMGLQTLVIADWTDILAYNTPTERNRLRQFVRKCHELKIQVLVYFGYHMSERAPEFSAFLDECAVWFAAKAYSLKWGKDKHYSIGEGSDNYAPKATQQVYDVCYRSEWKDFVVAGIARLMDEYDIDGVYLDQTGIPRQACCNFHHGCGKSDGTPGGIYALFDGRDTIRRIYAVVKSRKPDGQVNLHLSGRLPAPIMSWATSYWDGEQLKNGANKAVLSVLPLDMFCTEFMGHNWGVPAELLAYSLFTDKDPETQYRRACAIALLHDVPVRTSALQIGEPLTQLNVEAHLWNLFDQFGRKDAQRVPYWQTEADPAVKVLLNGAHVSLYRHPTNGVLAVVSNWTSGALLNVTLNAATLGLPGNTALTTADGKKWVALPFTNGAVSFDLPQFDWRIVRFQ